MKILGVDLGTHSIKVAELEASSKSFVFSNFFEFPLSPDPNRDQGLQIIEALRKLAMNYDPTSTKWIIGIPQHRVSVHYKRFPFRERGKILKSLPFELEDDIPLDIDETIFDFKTVEFVGQSTDVLTVASPKEAIEEVLDLSKDCGFDPEIVGVEGLALANIFTPWSAPISEVSPALRNMPEEGALTPPPLSRARLILHLGHSRSILLVYRETSLVAVRSFLWGGADIAAAITRAFNVPIFESIRVLMQKSFILMNSAGASADQVKLSATISDQVDILLKDLRLALLEMKSSFNLSLDSIELTGGTSQIQNLGPYLTQGLEIPANVNQDSVGRIPSRLSMTPQLESSAHVALGLAIEGMKRPRNPAVNLRKDDFSRENLSLKRFWQTWRVPAQVLATAFAIFFVYSIVRDQIAGSLLTTADEKITEAATKAAGLKGASANESNIRKYIKTQKTIIANQQALSQLDGYVAAMNVLSKISEKFPAKANGAVDVTLFELENEDLVIKGRAQPAQITAIERALKEIALPKTFATTAPEQGAGGFGFKLKVSRKD